ncbi:MarR family transcriptional regulator [Paralimibaculum aggregatum]|nr:MarR family transcriptional regulator [Limibaculum sp. NKW23]
MPMDTTERIRAFIHRLARLDAAETWTDDLNPAQIAALEYLARANRFSRAPSHVAEYLGTTRGTMSQTLKALERKGYLRESRSETDRRSITCHLTDAGIALAARRSALADAIAALPAAQRDSLSDGLSAVLAARLEANGGRAFGLCRTCIHHRPAADGAFCALLRLPLRPEEATQICHEQVAA